MGTVRLFSSHVRWSDKEIDVVRSMYPAAASRDTSLAGVRETTRTLRAVCPEPWPIRGATQRKKKPPVTSRGQGAYNRGMKLIQDSI